MRRTYSLAVVALTTALLALSFGAGSLAAQRPGPPPIPERLTVFLDCREMRCDRDFLITEIPYILLTQDRLDAEVHVLVTRISTGAGGSQFTYTVIGQRRFVGRVDTLVTSLPPNSTDDAERRELARVLQGAIAPYVLRTGAGPRLTVSVAPDPNAAGTGLAGVNDPWNFWVYRARANGNVGAESRSSDYSLRGSFSASRVTEQWKTSFRTNYEYESSTYELDSSTVSFAIRGAEFSWELVRSVSDHWSVGTGTSFGVDEFRNQDAAARVDVGAEWNYFPWREATSRQFVLFGALGARYFDYEEETIFERRNETRGAITVGLAAETRQAWGSLNIGAEHQRYLHDSDIYSASIYANMDVRISRGVSVNFGGNAQRVNDQLYLPRGDASDDEVLTRQRALATAYRVGVYAGVSFTFGSIFNTVVNPRFDAF